MTSSLRFVRCFDEDRLLVFIGGRILLHDPEDYPVKFRKRPADKFFYPESFCLLA